MKRREFMSLGSVGVLGSVSLGWNARPAEDAGEILSVGYWQGSEGRGWPLNSETDDDSPAPGPIVPADGLAAGDGHFLGTGAGMTIHGMVEAEPSILTPRVSELSAQVQFRIRDAGRTRSLPFEAWSYRREPLPSAGSAVSVRVPVHEDSGVRLTLARRDQNTPLGRALGPMLPGRLPAAGAVAETLFTVGSDAAAVKLRRGVYFLALAGNAARLGPDWSQHRFEPAPGDGIGGRLVHAGLLEERPAAFDYLVVSFDYAGEDRAAEV